MILTNHDIVLIIFSMYYANDLLLFFQSITASRESLVSITEEGAPTRPPRRKASLSVDGYGLVNKASPNDLCHMVYKAYILDL